MSITRKKNTNKKPENQNMFKIVCYVSLSHIDIVLFLRTIKFYFV